MKDTSTASAAEPHETYEILTAQLDTTNIEDVEHIGVHRPKRAIAGLQEVDKGKMSISADWENGIYRSLQAWTR